MAKKDIREREGTNDSKKIPGGKNTGSGPSRINKSAIIFSFAGLFIFFVIIGSLFGPSLLGKDKKLKTISTKSPNLDNLIPENPTETATIPENERPILFPPEQDIEETIEYAKEEEKSIPVPPQKTTSPKEEGFVGDFDLAAAGSGIAVPILNEQNFPAISDSSGVFGYAQSIASNLKAPNLQVPNLQASSLLNRAQLNPYSGTNNQQEKQNFAESGKPQVSEIINEYTLSPGTIVPAVLITGLNSDLPGNILAQVSENVFDYNSGKNLLIPSGSRLLAEYNSVVTFGQRRVQIGWSQLIRPDGVVVDLANAPGVDKQGFSGASGQVDAHAAQILGAVTFSAFTTFLTGLSAAATANLLNKGVIQTTAEEVTNELGDIGYDIAQRWLNVQPTITIDAGSKINVFVVQSISLPPAENNLSKEKYIRK